MNECNLREHLGERLKQARAVLDLTQKEFSLRHGLALPSLRDYELGNRVPGGEALCIYARAGIRVDWLLTGEGPMRLADGVAPAPAQPAPPLNPTMLAVCVQGVLEADPKASPARVGQLAADFYARLAAMEAGKTKAA